MAVASVRWERVHTLLIYSRSHSHILYMRPQSLSSYRSNSHTLTNTLFSSHISHSAILYVRQSHLTEATAHTLSHLIYCIWGNLIYRWERVWAVASVRWDCLIYSIWECDICDEKRVFVSVWLLLLLDEIVSYTVYESVIYCIWGECGLSLI